MCGTGVLQISGETGVRMLLVRMCSLLALYVWYQVDLANNALRKRDLDTAVARSMLLCTPFVLLAVWLTVKTFLLLNMGANGDCCSLAYGTPAGGGGFVFNRNLWLFCLAAASTVLLLISLYALSQKQLSSRLVLLSTSSGIFWCLSASVCLIYFFSAYYFGVTQHHCLWCLFLPGNYSIGYPLFFAMALVFCQSISIFVHDRLARSLPQLSAWSQNRMQRSCRLIIAGLFFYMSLTIFPAIL